MGILILGIAGIYLLISIIVVSLVVRLARKNGLRVKRWGWGAAFVMWLIPFWDWLPTIAVHQYYCATQSGFWVYKTLDQWKKENPGVFETLAVDHLPSEYYVGTEGIYDKYVLPDETVLKVWNGSTRRISSVDLKRPDGSYGYRLNERFSVITYAKQPIPGLITTVYTRLLMDTAINEIMAKGVRVGSSPGNFSVDPKAARFLPPLESCGSDVGSVTSEIRNMSIKNARK
jgi:hypothetical protein